MKNYKMLGTSQGGVIPVSRKGGEWVPAEVAQGLYDALRSCSEWDGLPPHLQSKADAALDAADGGGDG